MYKICLLSKYPPIQGGESSKAYWLVRGLGERGHELYLVTNAMEVENEYRGQLVGADLDYYQPKRVFVQNTDPFNNPHYIPYSNPYTEKLSNLAIRSIQDNDLQIIDSWYILPYCISGLIAKYITGKPLLVRHAGSDISRLFSSPYLHTLFLELFKKADKIITYPKHKEFFLRLGIPEKKLFINKLISIDRRFFNPEVPQLDLSTITDKFEDGISVITFLGKLHPTKGIYELIHVLEDIEEDFLFILVTGGNGIDRLNTIIKESNISDKTVLLGFLPPWRIPGLLRASTCVVCPERDFPVAGHSPILPREVIATGTCLIISEELYNKRHSNKVKNGESVLVVDPKNKSQFRNTLEWVIRNPESARAVGHLASQISEETEDFESYLDSIENLYSEILQNEY